MTTFVIILLVAAVIWLALMVLDLYDRVGHLMHLLEMMEDTLKRVLKLEGPDDQA